MPVQLFLDPISPPARAIHQLCLTLKIPLEVHIVDLGKGDHKKPEFLKINPNGKVPAINDDGVCLEESRAIAVYLIEKYRNHENVDKDQAEIFFPEKNLQKKAEITTAMIKTILFHEAVVGSTIYDKVFPQDFAPFKKNFAAPEAQAYLRKAFSTIPFQTMKTGQFLDDYNKSYEKRDFNNDKFNVADLMVYELFFTLFLLNFDYDKENYQGLVKLEGEAKKLEGYEAVHEAVLGFGAFFKENYVAGKKFFEQDL